MSEAPWRAHTFLAVGLTGKTQRYSRGTVGIVGIVSPCSARACRRRARAQLTASSLALAVKRWFRGLEPLATDEEVHFEALEDVSGVVLPKNALTISLILVLEL